MKKILVVLLTFFYSILLIAQPRNRLPFKNAAYKNAMKAAVLNITAEKYVAEVNETIKLTVTIDIIDDDGNPQKLDYRPEDPATAPWFVQDWKIVEGGGTLTADPKSNNNYYAVLTTPGKVPAGKCVIVEVTMQALDKEYPKTILRQTIYIEDNENVFYVNSPYLSIHQEKWVINATNGIDMTIPNVPANTKNLNEATDANQKAALERIRVAQAQQKADNMNFNIAAATSNCVALFSKEENTTAITLTGGLLKSIAGKPTNEKNNFLIVLSVPGRAMTRSVIKDKKNISVAITLPLLGKECGCNDDPEWKLEREKNGDKGPTCNGGFISIDEVVFGKNGFVKGHFAANLEGTTVDGQLFYTDIEGKFKANLVN